MIYFGSLFTCLVVAFFAKSLGSAVFTFTLVFFKVQRSLSDKFILFHKEMNKRMTMTMCSIE